MTKNSINENNSIKMFNLLINNSITKDEICSILNIKLPTFYKCYKKLKDAGIEIEKNGLLYSASKFSKTITYTPLETSILAYLVFLADTMLPEKKNKILKNAVLKMLYISTKENYDETLKKYEILKQKANENTFKEKIELLQKYKDAKYALKIVLRSGREYDLTPIDFHWENNKVYFYFMDSEIRKRKMISIEKIVKIIPEHKFNKITEAKETIFELYGRLAKIYVLKEDERVVDNFPDRLVIANGSSDKEVLFKRLFRYDELCKVLFPKEDVEAFKRMIEKSLDNID